ncbi:MAG TPA: hypothetical protein VHU83_08660 [Bryobacteraceae bacterium]|nr:hypothetical protein [Bryobacteraceae bacterium]
MSSHTPESGSNELVRGHGPKRSEPHGGHGGTTYEGVDASVKLVIYSLAIIALTLVVTLAITVPIHKALHDTTPLGEPASPLAPARVVPPNPQLQVHPWEELPDLRAHEQEVLNSGGKDADGRVHISINQAMDNVVSGLTIAPNAAEGINTPGGQGRDFATSVNAMPAPYRQPQISGEIRKNAQ